MADWSFLDREWLAASTPAPYDPYQYPDYDPYYQEKPQQQPMYPIQQRQPYLSPPSPTLTLLLASPRHLPPPAPMLMPLPAPLPPPVPYMPPTGETPRQLRSKQEKQRRDNLNLSIAELASMVPPVVAATRKVDKTGVLRLTAHYLRAHQYVFGDTIGQGGAEFTAASSKALLKMLNGFLLTTTYKGLIVVVSQNVNEYLGYSELDLLGQNIFNLTHLDDRQMLRDQLMPRSQKFGAHGELLIPEDGDGIQPVAQALANEKRRFIVRFKKLGQRSEPSKYVTCHVEGSLRKSDRACRGGQNRPRQMVRRARARGENPCASGNDVVFIGVVRPTAETFINESVMESYKMEYRTRHSIDGEIIQCEQRIALVTGYMTDEVHGVNAMNFIHRDEVRFVIVALRKMYDHNILFGESCYRLITKNGQLIYMNTRGRLDVDEESRAVTSFVCTNTVVSEREGKQLIKMMKEKLSLDDSDNENILPVEDTKDDFQAVPVENPRQLEKVILHLVHNLPSPSSSPYQSPNLSSELRLSIIPPGRERILNAIEKIYSVIKTIPKQPSIHHGTEEASNSPTSDEYLQMASYPPLPFDNSYLIQSNAMYSSGISSFGMPYHGMMPYSNRQQIESPMLSPPTNFQDKILKTIPGLSAGVKRTKDFDQDEKETSNKKKIGTEPNVEQHRCNSPTLETFFDKAILNSQIESVIDSLEHSIDPNFPDLLISNEIEELLRKIEGSDENIGNK